MVVDIFTVLLNNKKMRGTEATHEKRIAPIAATQIFHHPIAYESRADVFAKIKTQLSDLKVKFVLQVDDSTLQEYLQYAQIKKCATRGCA